MVSCPNIFAGDPNRPSHLYSGVLWYSSLGKPRLSTRSVEITTVDTSMLDKRFGVDMNGCTWRAPLPIAARFTSTVLPVCNLRRPPEHYASDARPPTRSPLHLSISFSSCPLDLDIPAPVSQPVHDISSKLPRLFIPIPRGTSPYHTSLPPL